MFIILAIVFLAEVLFGAYCVRISSNRPNIKGYIRIGTFIVFLLLLISIEWSFRWYTLAALLLIRAIIGAYTLLRNKKTRQEYKTWRIVGSSVLAFLLTVLAAVPAIVFPQYVPPQATGAYKIATMVYTFTDKNRLEIYTENDENRTVTAEFWYPTDAEGTYPLVVFTHGLYGIAASNNSTYAELASNGYVVCSISHPYISMLTKNADGKIITVSNEYIRTASILNSGIDDEEVIYDAFKNLNDTRTEDVNFVLDSILSNAGKSTDSVFQLIDTTKIGLFGHSMGGATMTSVGRERNDIGAVINLDAPLFGELLSYQNGEVALIDTPYPEPLLNIYSDDLWGKMDEDPKYAANAKLLSNTPDRIFNLHIEGAKHMNFTDLTLYSPIIANALQGGKAGINSYDCLKTMNGLILEFFNCYLKDAGDFQPEF